MCEWCNPTDQDGTNISLESPNLSAAEPNAPADEWEPSLSEIDGLFLQAIMALRQATQAASKALVREGIRGLNPDRPTTPDQGVASPFMLRLMLYSGLIVTIVEELRSTVPTPPVMDVPGSFKVQESPSSSPRKVEPFSASEVHELPITYDEPPIGSLVADQYGDFWHRRDDGWHCAIDGDDYSEWNWARLTKEYKVRVIVEGQNF